MYKDTDTKGRWTPLCEAKHKMASELKFSDLG